MKYLKFLSILFLLITPHNLSLSKPVPPGAGDGDVAANILFLVDSSASMQSWIGSDGLGAVPKAVYDSDGKILINQNGRRAVGIVRYTSAGERDTDFTPVRITPAAGCSNVYDTTRSTANRNVRRNAGLNFVEGFSGLNITNQNMFFFINRERADRDMVFGFTEDGTNCLFALHAESARGRILDIDIKKIGDIHYMFVAGSWRRGGFFKTCNLSTMACTNEEFRGNTILRHVKRISVNNEGTFVYMTSRDGNVSGFSLDLTDASPLGSVTTIDRICESVNNPTLRSDIMYATTVAVSPDNSNILYTGSHVNHAIQKLELTDTTCTVLESIGAGINSVLANKGTSADTDADDIRFSRVWGMHVNENGKILTATGRGYVDEFNESAFTEVGRDTAWLQQMGGPRLRRWDGVKNAINAIVNDTTLTTGAHFGFGHWNAGISGKGKNSTNGGAYCHRNPNCSYYGSWNGEHPAGSSSLCNTDSCLNIGISSNGASQIMAKLEPMGLAWGTDSQAFSDLAFKYFNDANAGGKVFDEDSLCQLNYVIVIGDGAMTNTGINKTFADNAKIKHGGQSIQRMEALRKQGVKSLYVAYGGGIKGNSMKMFDEFARAGSCAELGDKECEETIIADTPEELKSELASKIRQIIADKLAFTAPSITATIQEGGSLYQAQFAYEQFGEWKGTILRKKLNSDGTVEHTTTEPNPHGNWSAAVKIKSQSTADDADDGRNLWSAIPGASYFNNWDNFKVANSDKIASELFDMLGYTVPDYHNASSYCATRETGDKYVGNNGNDDDIKGLIKFMKGNDYFDYNGNCNVTEVRDHVMGDIYHSQLIEVGPPDANLEFSNTNEEAYYRSINNYQGFMSKHAQRENIIYAGSNSGILHAINAKTGKEEWGFIPPFIAALLPQIINKGYDGMVDATIAYVLDDEGNPKLGDDGKPIPIKKTAGGTNPLFGVDGSPVIHDVLIEGYDKDGNQEGKEWRTILFVPYGRGGAGFSVLDVTNPIIGDGGPIHMFSIFNDQINKKVLISKFDGSIVEETYNSGFSSFLQTEEGMKVSANYVTAREEDDDECNSTDDDDTNNCVQQDAIAKCIDSDEMADTDPAFRDEGTSSCYISDTFHFADITLDVDDDTAIAAGVLTAKEVDNETGLISPLGIADARMKGGFLRVKFDKKLVINANRNDHVDGAEKETNQFSISTSCKGATGIPVEYDYTQLGETWSTPRIVRIPSVDGGGLNNDRYVAVMGGGMSKNDTCAGSAVFLVDLHLDERETPGRIYGAIENRGPITIVDTTPDGVMVGGTMIATENGSDIANAIPAAPLVITPDTAFNIPWRGALVYVNDLEGKITKINLTNSKKNSSSLFDQTTLFSLNANTDNARYSYFAMDAGIGLSKNQLMLFGSTGNFTDLGGRETNMDNIMYGVTDVDYPFFKHLNLGGGGKVPRGDNDTFFKLAHEGANAAANVDDAADCKNVTGATDFEECTAGKDAWVIKLGQDANNNFYVPKTFRKASASPTLFKGQVYFPIYQPPDAGVNRCAQGSAFICVSDDECGYNNSAKLKLPDAPSDVNNPGANACAFVRKGILSELVIFADKLFANVAGPTGDEDTLFSILSIPGEIMQNKGGWRDSSF